MRTLFILSLLLILYTYAGYPLLIAALARLRPRPWRKSPITPSVTILMAVHNGAPLLPAQLDHLITLEPTLVHQVIVISDGSTDATPTLLAAHPTLASFPSSSPGTPANPPPSTPAWRKPPLRSSSSSISAPASSPAP